MKIFGRISELVSAVFRKNSYEITIKPNNSTYTGAVELQLPPKLTGNDVLVGQDVSQTVSAKNLETSVIRDSSRLDGAMVRKEVDASGNPILYFHKDGGANKIGMYAPPGLGSDYNFVLPTGAGTNKYPLLTDGFGNTSWSQITDASVDSSAAIAGSKIQAASGTTNPGVLSTGSQNIGGIKTFLSNPVMSGLTANSAVITDGSKTLTSLEYNSASTGNSLVLRNASGNFEAGTITATLNGNATNVTGIVAGANGGTGIANTGKTITLGGNLTTSGAFATTLTSTATTSVTLPTTGTLATLAGSEALSNKTITASSVSSDPATTVGTGAFKLPTGNATTDRPSGTASQLKGMVRYNDTDDVFEGYNELSGWSSIGGGGTSDRVTQASHGFVVGDTLYLNGSTYTKAIATSAGAAEVVGVVSRVIDASTFELTLSGEISGLTGLTTGEVYFLSAATAGALTTTEPSVIGQVSVPVGIASSTTTLYVAPKRGAVVGGTNARTELSLANNASSTIYTAPAGLEAGEITGWVYINATTDYRFFVRAQFAKNGLDTDWNISAQTTGDTPPAGYAISISSGGVISLALPSLAGFVSAKINYALNAPAVGATFPLAVDASTITTGTVSSSNLPVASASQAGIVSLSNQSLGAGDKYFGGKLGVGTTTPNWQVQVASNTTDSYIQLTNSATGTASTDGLLLGIDTLAANIIQRENLPLVFYTNNTERARIEASGNLLVGTTSNPSGFRTHIIGATGGNPVLATSNSTSSGNVQGIRSTIESNGNNTSSSHFAGLTQGVSFWYLYGNGTHSYTSDIRKKKNVETARGGYLDDLCQLRVVKYNWNIDDDSKPKELGLIAQEVEQVFPGLVQNALDADIDGETYKVLKGSVLPVMLLKAIQELKAELDSTKAELAAVKEQLSK